MLHFARMLRAGVHQPLVLFLRQSIGHLAFQIEMLLSADFQHTGQVMWRPSQSIGGVTPLDKNRGKHVALSRHRVLHTQDRWQGFDVELDLACGMAGLHHGLGNHQPDHLANVLYGVRRENRLVADERCQHGVSRNVTGQHAGANAGHRQCV